ncbi:SPFH domain-containing protein [uncultured Paludibaculum sp.]|uniref:SPFH domain-containing protein n=1 Tax=uncultured Paludibaculum sp. TaxID=1765020 RepID=UPI002AAAA436|nr:SPFH domain-containing protein [uncultured Paludibaculum sp.]
MLLLKYLLMATGASLLLAAAIILVHDLYLLLKVRREEPAEGEVETAGALEPARPIRWRLGLRLAILAVPPVLIALSILVIPSGSAGIRVSQISGPLPGTLYPGVHAVTPMIDSVVLYNIRESVFTAAASDDPKKKPEGLRSQSKEGLNVSLAVTVRYRLDPNQLYKIHTSLPELVGEDVVAPVVTSAFRELTTNYSIRDLFAGKRDEVRQIAAGRIAKRLSADGIVVKEVILRDVQLPAEYARGLEAMLLKEQENERLTVELEAKEKEVKVAQMEASSQRDIAIKEAEGQAQAKLLDSRAESERQKLLAEAEEVRIRRVASANSEKMRLEAVVLKENPMLIQKIIAERLSDKVQIMMIPADVKNFFATDVLRSAMTGHSAQ